jgi:hypothetical protein
MKRFAFVLVFGIALGLLAFADAPLPASDDESFYPAYTAANPTAESRAGDIGGTQDMLSGPWVLVTVDETVQTYVDK